MKDFIKEMPKELCSEEEKCDILLDITHPVKMMVKDLYENVVRERKIHLLKLREDTRELDREIGEKLGVKIKLW